jgi:hypothetical protein
LPPVGDPFYLELGRAVARFASKLDAGPAAFEECRRARDQLETIVRDAAGIDATVAVYGGIVVNSFLECGGDVDFVAIGETQEPTRHEAGTMVQSLARELRRLGLRASPRAQARVPVVNVDRVSFALPGSPMLSVSKCCMFRSVRPVTPEEQHRAEATLTQQYGATRVEWRGGDSFVATFSTTDDCVRALAGFKVIPAPASAAPRPAGAAGGLLAGEVPLPLRLPADPRAGPELYRYPFDVTVHSSGLQNSHLFRKALESLPFARHMVLFIKRWARTGKEPTTAHQPPGAAPSAPPTAGPIVDSYEGMLASYAVTVMAVHFLVRAGAVAPAQLRDVQDPQLLPAFPQYRPLEMPTVAEEEDSAAAAAAGPAFFGNAAARAKRAVASTAAAQPSASEVAAREARQQERDAELEALGYYTAQYFHYFANVFDYTNDVVCTTTRQRLDKTTLRWSNEMPNATDPSAPPQQRVKPPFYHMCIKDPCNAENIARNLTGHSAQRVVRAHAEAMDVLAPSADEGEKDAGFIVSVLTDATTRAVLRRNSSAVASSPATGASASDAAVSGPSTAGAEGAPALEAAAEARRELGRVVFHRRKETIRSVGARTAASNERVRAAQDLTRQLVEWIRVGDRELGGAAVVPGSSAVAPPESGRPKH